MNINITDSAQVKIREFAAANNEEPVVRIFVQKATCYEARFGIVIDSFKQGDEITQKGDIIILTDSEYVPRYSNGINIDYSVNPKEGFIISSALPIKRNFNTVSHSKKCGGNCGGCSKAK